MHSLFPKKLYNQKLKFSSGEDDGEWDPTRVVTIHVPHNAAVQVHR